MLLNEEEGKKEKDCLPKKKEKGVRKSRPEKLKNFVKTMSFKRYINKEKRRQAGKQYFLSEKTV